jgi:hypothetical protein
MSHSVELLDQIHDYNTKLMRAKMPVCKITEFLQKGANMEHQELNEELKAKFLYRLVREYRHSIEHRKQ